MAINPWPGMTQADVDRRIDMCAKKRDRACDVLNQPLLGLSYQQEIDEWILHREKVPPVLSAPEQS